jgi:hypothetical protein
MISIRPHKLFNLVKTETYGDRIVKLVLPDQQTPMTFDLMIKLALARLLKPRTFFEIGTFLGVHTFDMAMNIPDCHFIHSTSMRRHTGQRRSSRSRGT